VRRWVIVAAVLANALSSALVLLLLWRQSGWNEEARLSATRVDLLILAAAVAFVLNLVLAPVVALGFWREQRKARTLQHRVVSLAARDPASPSHTFPDADA